MLWGHSLIKIKWDREKIFSKIGKLTTTNKDKKVTYYNSSLKLWLERKYTIELMLMKNWRKGLVFLVAKRIKAKNGVFTIVNGNSQYFEVNGNSQYFGAIKVCKKFFSPITR